jgi:hypothetical protein
MAVFASLDLFYKPETRNLQSAIEYPAPRGSQRVSLIKKIPNFKHQITNKSQISIINDRNKQRACITLLLIPMSADVEAIVHSGRQILCLACDELSRFEFRILVIGIYLRFVFWCLEFFGLNSSLAPQILSFRSFQSEIRNLQSAIEYLAPRTNKIDHILRRSALSYEL